ncbi:hypothetical protein IDSA_08345 [Pseudidiomarina salinarum]|uniref:Ribosomal RNA large subunit methyltransferase J n=1 Tax=Pseudidiomarina salinarum TaxID=435908 RepID=A0A094IXF9_9GAMM|nr:23S rRNA (adenine(2030)-N(6))-methyltransferase RlmJ [Pseudidiomarina salinarum]KFZ30539.1 hypothetical protein IDSA_08345 [Pseudidiomarina salinarum]RUO69049.1 23S rRNA (adenine(2030)-N(6))-methyltransferase RlmJ [Pseudidiomarina salinarum]
MNYRHSYHAGNFADVLKHSLQMICLDYLRQKDKPFWVLDTHAGIGMYDLRGEQASKTAEWEQGIARLLDAENPPAALSAYLDCVRVLNPDGELRWYPGSPWLSARQLRSQDSLVLCELHPEDGGLLEQNVRRDFRSAGSVKVMTETDGYGAVKALLPPPAKRGLVLIDPPFEQRDEFIQASTALGQGLQRWANGTYAVWYPIKDPLNVGVFHKHAVRLAGADKVLAVDLMIRAPHDRTRLNGCGMFFINPPYGLLQQLTEVMEFLTPLLAQGEGAEWRATWPA